MTSWENPVPVAAFFSSSDLENSSPRDSQVPPLIVNARSRTYDAVCIPLTTAKWMERWRGMCVISSEPDERPEGSDHRAETWRANPVFQLGEVTMTRLGMSPQALTPAWLHLLMYGLMDQRKLKALS
jgi:protein arginine N-methyltransferase 5